MSKSDHSFYVAGATIDRDAACYVERLADKDIYRSLAGGTFCYVLTSRHMGKSSLMVRAAHRLRLEGLNVVVADLMAIGVNLTPEQWYNGILTRVGCQLNLEEDLDDYWQGQQNLGPLDRFFSALREVVLPRHSRPLVIFIDEIDTVRSLPFATDEFFASIANSRTRESGRLAFCLLGVSTPTELIRDKRRTPFTGGRRIELHDFTRAEAGSLAVRLHSDEAVAGTLLERILFWTNGHPYLTQRLCEGLTDTGSISNPAAPPADRVDALCQFLCLSKDARNADPNLVFVREWILGNKADLTRLLELYQRVYRGEEVPDDDTNDLIHQLRLSGIAKVTGGRLLVRNRIYSHVFDQDWISLNIPDAELEKSSGERKRIKGRCFVGRIPGNDLILDAPEISRHHALIQAQSRYEFWLQDLGSRNGTYLNGCRVIRPTLLRNNDTIEIGPFRFEFHQSKTAPPSASLEAETLETVRADPRRSSAPT